MNAADEPPAGEVTRILHAVRDGHDRAGDVLLETVYEELRRIARAKMQGEPPGHTLQATALVHEAWLRLGDGHFNSRAHYFAAAAEAMRRILVERARRRNRMKHGAGAEHCELGGAEIAAPLANGDEILAVHDALDQLALHDGRKADLVKLRYFAGLSFDEAAEVLGISVPTAKRDWAYARAWLHHAIGAG
jgi:RNA polymerase sigma factor (TIGR02999 family)